MYNYIIDIDKLDDYSKILLNKDEINIYMHIVGSLVWISGVRPDIIFAVMYLAWFTKTPRRHHLLTAYSVVTYLYYSKEYPLILGGIEPLHIVSYSDASLSTGPSGKSINGNLTKMSDNSGSVITKSTTSQFVRLSSFEAELEACNISIKTISRLIVMLSEIGIICTHSPTLYSDNMAMTKFVKGEGIVKGLRHMERRMYFARERYKYADFELFHIPGKKMPADQLTKPCNKDDFERFRYNILGLGLDSERFEHVKREDNPQE
jgi:hypothetical protein